MRPSWDEWAFGIVEAISKRGDCTRRQVGSLILMSDHRIAGCGYNGGRPGGPSCLEGSCPRGRHYRQPCQNPQHFHSNAGKFACIDFDTCACGSPWPCPDAVAPGSSYDTGPGACISSHAEANAVADAMQRNGGRLKGCTMYVSCEPCEGCVRHVRNQTDITAIIWPEGVIALP